MDDRAQLGRRGEQLAAIFLKKQRHRVVARNYTCSVGEIDLITLDGDTVVFVEVKTRTSRELAAPQDAVNRRKQRKIIRVAQFFIQQTGSQERACRFDIIAVTINDDGQPEIEHFANAFVP